MELILYVRTGCPYCAKVIRTLNELGCAWTEKNISDDSVAEELIKRGGKKQVPYLVDDVHNIEMYESDDIVAYLRDNFSPKQSV